MKNISKATELRTDINQWIEDTMFYVIMRKQNDKNDKSILFLFRLLAIKYRYTYPLHGGPMHIDEELKIVLESKICNAAGL